MERIYGNNYFEDVMKLFEFYDFNEMSSISGKQVLIKFNHSVDEIIYSDLQFGGDKLLYDKKEKKMCELLEELFSEFKDTSCLIRKYERKWIVDKTLSKELYLTLKANNIENHFDGMIVVKKDDKAIMQFFESIYKYNSFVQFLFPEERMVISPTDHMDVFIAAEDFEGLNLKLLNYFKKDNYEEIELVEV